ncbi:protein of unknown function DUF159 [Dethiobacter alkaliphilus AHT 1]|uniref:Abasic site processing protein n=1 Tax=Dethiobacter alkaliphilus AHT 1 TaxID=555088 RepID=C0GD93_DETAL|nr:SOS response-associated peptidase [Dethiobacter alkaliphilus]EEG78614.1 protein of unknown function DUF159 [Dethiobacter alkaliphilus AHT 1]
MCGRYTFVETGKLWERFGVEGAQLVPRYNVAPTQEVPVITGSEKRRLVQMRWGLVPHWAKEISIGSRMINARGETVEEKPSFRSSFRHKRCLVPADGFFEWQRQNGLKVPYRFTLANGGLFAMAGLWTVGFRQIETKFKLLPSSQQLPMNWWEQSMTVCR